MASPPSSPPPTLRPALKHSSTSGRRPSELPLGSAGGLLSPPIPSPSPTPGQSNVSFSSYFPRTLSNSSAVHSVIPLAGYRSGVGFDTFGETTTELFSFTLQAKSDFYKRTRKTRSYLCASGPDESGQEALDWAVETLVESGDELVVFRGFDGDDNMSQAEQESRREEARDLLKEILEKNEEYQGRQLSVIVEFVAGKVTTNIERLIALYRPDSLIVGTRGTSKMKAWGAALGAPGMGSVSRWCVSHSPVPVIVVRPERKVQKTLKKRRADPKRAEEFEKLQSRLAHGGAT